MKRSEYITEGHKKKITAKKYGGDDQYSWAIFVDGRPAFTGLHRSEIAYYKKLAADTVNKTSEDPVGKPPM